MSARKFSNSDVLTPITVQARTTRLEVPSNAVRIHKNGIEFRSQFPISSWSEMTVGLQTPEDSRKVQFTGVVVACHGNPHQGYKVSMVFTSVSPKAQARLSALAS